MAWKIYSWVLAAILGFTYFSIFEGKITTADVLDVPISLTALIGLFGYAYKKKIGKKQFWQIWFVLIISWDILYNLFLSKDSGVPSIWMVVGLIFFLPEYVALYKYAFTQQFQWDQNQPSLCQSSTQEIKGNSDFNQVLYATLPRRIKASIIDGTVLLALMILTPLIFSSLTGTNTWVNAIAMFTPVLLLEPFLTTYLGFTLGQYIFGIQVVRLDTGGKCPLVASFARYYLKFILGSLSMVYMLFSKKHQAIHDHVAKTLVVLSHKRIEKNPAFAEYGDKEQELEKDCAYTYPSALRRFGFFFIWLVVASIGFVVVIEGIVLFLLPGYTLETEKLPKGIEIATNFIYSIMFIVIAVFASKGSLPGAKKIKKENLVIHENNSKEEWF